MDTKIYGEIPIFNRKQVRDLYAKAVKSNFDSFDPGELVEVGVMPFPGDEEIRNHDDSVRQGLEYAIGMIEEADVGGVPPVYMIDTRERDGNRATVWVIANGEVATFTQVNIARNDN